MELISSSVTPNKASIFEEPRLTKEENEEATHNYYTTRVRPRGDKRDYRKAWIIRVLGPVLPRLGPYYLLPVLNHALPGALILVKPRAYEVYGAWRSWHRPWGSSSIRVAKKIARRFFYTGLP